MKPHRLEAGLEAGVDNAVLLILDHVLTDRAV